MLNRKTFPRRSSEEKSPTAWSEGWGWLYLNGALPRQALRHGSGSCAVARHGRKQETEKPLRHPARDWHSLSSPAARRLQAASLAALSPAPRGDAASTTTPAAIAAGEDAFSRDARWSLSQNGSRGGNRAVAAAQESLEGCNPKPAYF